MRFRRVCAVGAALGVTYTSATWAGVGDVGKLQEDVLSTKVVTTTITTTTKTTGDADSEESKVEPAGVLARVGSHVVDEVVCTLVVDLMDGCLKLIGPSLFSTAGNVLVVV